MFERFKNIFTVPLGGRKKDAMDQKDTAVPPATGGGIDQEALAKLIAATVATALAESNKGILEQLGKLSAPAPALVKEDGAKPQAAKPLTLEDVKGFFAEKEKSAATAAAREKFAAEKLADVPAAYRGQLPHTDDAAQLAAAEQKIRADYRADLKAKGFEVKDVGGAVPGGGVPAAKAPVDLSKLSATELMEMGLKQAGPVQRTRGATAA
jgi:hypothetical protein